MENSLFKSVYNPDVLSCIANLSNDEVFTPTELANKIELVKYIVSVKLAESEARVNAAEKKAQRDKIMKIVAKKKDKELEDMDVEQLMKKLEELN